MFTFKSFPFYRPLWPSFHFLQSTKWEQLFPASLYLVQHVWVVDFPGILLPEEVFIKIHPCIFTPKSLLSQINPCLASQAATCNLAQ